MSAKHLTAPDGSRPITKAPGYRVEDGGLVWSCLDNKSRLTNNWHIVKPCEIGRLGYVRYMLYVDKKRWRTWAHVLVLEAFVGPCPDGMEGCHWDGNPANNYASNLRWDTHVNNESDKIRHGTLLVGERVSTAKFKDGDIPEVFRLYNEGLTMSEIGNRYGVDWNAVKFILDKKTWKHASIGTERIKRNKQPKGDRHYRAKLTESDIGEMKRLSAKGLRNIVIARLFGVSSCYVCDVLKNRCWKHVKI